MSLALFQGQPLYRYVKFEYTTHTILVYTHLGRHCQSQAARHDKLAVFPASTVCPGLIHNYFHHSFSRYSFADHSNMETSITVGVIGATGNVGRVVVQGLLDSIIRFVR